MRMKFIFVIIISQWILTPPGNGAWNNSGILHSAIWYIKHFLNPKELLWWYFDGLLAGFMEASRLSNGGWGKAVDCFMVSMHNPSGR